MLVFIFNSCKDNGLCTTCDNFSDGFVIGFDPCTGVEDPNGGEVGFLIHVNSQKDTVVAYNFPAGIYDFPPEYFINYRYECFFPDSALLDFPIKIKYRPVTENEKNHPVCRGDILTGQFNPEDQIKLLTITK